MPAPRTVASRAAELEQILREEGYRTFVQLVARAREALAKVVPHREDLRKYLLNVNAVPNSADEIAADLKKGPK